MSEVKQNDNKSKGKWFVVVGVIVGIATLIVAILQLWHGVTESNKQEHAQSTMIDISEHQRAAQETLVAIQQNSGSPQQIADIKSTIAALENERLHAQETLTPGFIAQTITIEPIKTTTPKLPPVIPSDTPVLVSNGAVFFGQSKNINGLVVSVSLPDYDSGCSGTLDFELTLFNETSNPIVLGFGLGDIKLLGNGESQLSLFGDYGAATPRCYGNFNVETLAPNSTVKFAIRTTNSLGSYSYLELVFGEKTGRLAGEKWRLDLSATSDIRRTPFGQIVNVDGLEVTVGEENYFPGCNGTLGFQINLRNTTGRPIILSMNSGNLKLYGDNGSGLSLYSQLGSQSTDCYGSFNLETIQAGDTVLIAMRNTSSLSGLSYVDFVFETDNRLDGLRWRLTLPR